MSGLEKLTAMFYFSGRCAQCIEVKYNIFVMDGQQRGNV